MNQVNSMAKLSSKKDIDILPLSTKEKEVLWLFLETTRGKEEQSMLAELLQRPLLVKLLAQNIIRKTRVYQNKNLSQWQRIILGETKLLLGAENIAKINKLKKEI